jgi:hypothetical protein
LALVFLVCGCFHRPQAFGRSASASAPAAAPPLDEFSRSALTGAPPSHCGAVGRPCEADGAWIDASLLLATASVDQPITGGRPAVGNLWTTGCSLSKWPSGLRRESHSAKWPVTTVSSKFQTN